MLMTQRTERAAACEWIFFHDMAGRWRWEQRSGPNMLAESADGYATREECVSDACRNGFLLAPAAAAAAEPSRDAVAR
jgi:hypothetical protein